MHIELCNHLDSWKDGCGLGRWRSKVTGPLEIWMRSLVSRDPTGLLGNLASCVFLFEIYIPLFWPHTFNSIFCTYSWNWIFYNLYQLTSKIKRPIGILEVAKERWKSRQGFCSQKNKWVRFMRSTNHDDNHVAKPAHDLFLLSLVYNL